MTINTVIFDMDGLLIDSEPYWEEAGRETLEAYGITLTNEQYHQSTGLRTREWIDWWLSYFNADKSNALEAEQTILRKALEKIDAYGTPMPGVEHIFSLFQSQGFRIGLATSSPIELVDIVAKKLGIGQYLEARASAAPLAYGKPHPQVYLDCAEKLGVSPLQCICFEDSFNGLIAAKAARMRCVVIPAPEYRHETKWGAADLKLDSLEAFTADTLNRFR